MGAAAELLPLSDADDDALFGGVAVACVGDGVRVRVLVRVAVPEARDASPTATC